MECRIGDLSVYYEMEGAGRPILMIHGYSVDHRLMAGCMEPLSRTKGGFQRIYVDMPTPPAMSGDRISSKIMVNALSMQCWSIHFWLLSAVDVDEAGDIDDL